MATESNPYLALLGGLLGFASTSDGGQQQQTQTNDPWWAAAPYLQQNLATNQQLQNHYLQNPFSAEQKAAYQNSADVLANNRANSGNFNQIASNFMGSKGGKMAAMPGLLSDTKAAPIDFKAMNPYQSGLLSAPGEVTPATAPVPTLQPNQLDALKTQLNNLAQDLRKPTDAVMDAGRSLPGGNNSPVGTAIAPFLNPVRTVDNIGNGIAKVFGW